MMEKLRKISKTYYLRQIVACLMVYCVLLGIPAQVALAVNPGNLVNIPSGPGSVNFIGSVPGNTVVNVQSNKAIINWSNFDTIPGELISFLRGTDFAVLNRVVYGGPTNFLGTLNAPLGNVFLINSRGIIFGPSSYINARNFVASGLGMRDLDFLNGDLVNPDNINYRFGYGDRFGLGDLKSVTVDTIGDVTNEGIGTDHGINAEQVALIGQNVTNKGIIRTAPGGTVIMAAGETVLLSEVGSNVVVEVTMTDPALPGQHVVDNGGDVGGGPGTGPGTIEATDSKVILAAGDIFSTAISGIESLAAEAHRDVTLEGDITANSTIRIVADRDYDEFGDVEAKGTLIANGKDSLGTSMFIAGDNITLHKDAEAAGDMILSADLNAGGLGSLFVKGKLTTSDGGDITMKGGDGVIYPGSGIHLQYDGEEPEVDADGTIFLKSETYADDGVKLAAGQDVILAVGKTLDGYGALTIEADNHIDLHGAVTTAGKMHMVADRDKIGGGDVIARRTLIANGKDSAGESMVVTGENVTLAKDATAAGDMILTADRDENGDGKLFVRGKLTTTDGGNIEMTGGYSSDYGINLEYNGTEPEVEADGSILLNSNTKAYDGVKLDAGLDVVLDDDKSLTGDGTLTVEADRDISLRGPVEAKGAGNVNLTTINGDVWVDDVKAIDNQITIDSGGAIREEGSDLDVDLTAETLDLTANDGIPGYTTFSMSIETAANKITAKTIDTNKTAANIILSNNNDSPTSLTASTAGTKSLIAFQQIGGGELTLTDLSTNDGSIYVSAEEGDIAATQVNAGGPYNVELRTITSGNVRVDDVQALGDEITINSAGAILENGNDGDPDLPDLTAATLSLTAKTGITGQSPIETSATDITASTDEGNIDIDNTNGSPTTASLAVTTGEGTILFSQDGDGPLDVTSATTADGSIGIDVDNATLTAQTVTAGGDDDDDDVSLSTTTSGDVLVDNITAAGNQITINSVGAISEYGDDPEADLTADTLLLTAKDGIGRQNPVLIETAANTITARTVDENKLYARIWLSNNNSSPTSLTASTVGESSWIVFKQTGGGELTLTDVSTSTNDFGSIYIDAYSGDIVATQVNAGGLWSAVRLETHDSGDITVGSVTSARDQVFINSAGSINDAADDKTVDIMAPALWLTARDEIGGSPKAGKTNDTLGAIETDVAILEARSTGLGGEDGGGDIVIVEKDNVELQDVIAESGSIFLEATNGGMTHILPEEDEDPFIIKAGGSTLTMVQQNDLELEYFTFANQENTDLMMESYYGAITAVDTANGGKDENAADQWQSIQAIAKDNIVLQGSDSEEDIKIGTHEGFDPSSHPFGGVVASWDGGVSIISEKGAVRTADDTILDDVEIWGISDDEQDIGVDLPYGPGKAAILIMSEDTLTLGEDSKLTASGWYDTTGDVDDRAGVGFLDVPEEIPSGYPRYKGDPFDAAIYLASTDGDVEVSSPVSITSFEILLDGIGEDEPYPELVFTHEGTMVIDAFDSVTFGEAPGSPFEVSLANGEVGDRLEVASRITEWLYQAAGRLPYSSYPYYGGGPFPLDYTYVLRGAGLENPAISGITEGLGRAWVLVDPQPAPLDREAGELAERLTLGLEGCPVLVAAASAELGIPGETIEVYLADAFALNTDIQPCESCARLVNAGAILRDEDGSRMAAMNQVFNELAPADSPFTPEMAASIVTAFAGRVNDGTQYATAIEYIDAFVQYIAVLNTEMGAPVGDSIAFVMQKYGTGLTESENNNIAAFVATRLESGETFAD
jgi:filamentous hemagglutinin family protein